MRKVVSVAIGIVRGLNGRVLISKRRAEVVDGGLWEFPGGKVNEGESSLVALVRELYEEVGITPLVSIPTLTVNYRHEKYDLKIAVYEVPKWSGKLHSKEKQELRWIEPLSLSVYRMPAPNKPIKIAAMLPHYSLVTPAFLGDEDIFLKKIKLCLSSGVQLIQFRPQIQDKSLCMKLAKKVCALCAEFDALVMLNVKIDDSQELIDHFGGVHFSSHELLKLTKRPVPTSMLASASCHNQEELFKAKEVGLDFAYLSPILPPISHPSPSHLGWGNAEDLASQAGLPLYGLGGLKPSDVSTACSIGLQGLSMVSGFWDVTNPSDVVSDIEKELLAFQVDVI